MAKYNNNNPN